MGGTFLRLFPGRGPTGITLTFGGFCSLAEFWDSGSSPGEASSAVAALVLGFLLTAGD